MREIINIDEIHLGDHAYTLREKIARALYARHGKSNVPWDDLKRRRRGRYQGRADEVMKFIIALGYDIKKKKSPVSHPDIFPVCSICEAPFNHSNDQYFSYIPGTRKTGYMHENCAADKWQRLTKEEKKEHGILVNKAIK